jgi:hypothetical protein
LKGGVLDGQEVPGPKARWKDGDGEGLGFADERGKLADGTMGGAEQSRGFSAEVPDLGGGYG